ncbi:hypothetical protein BH24ACT23_BH24ACT23_12350 [soil metagenome]
MERFRIEARIGSGGMGTVYRAFDERLQREVAIKEIRTSGADRVLREAQAAARLNHAAIVTLYELGEREGHALLVSELVHGRTLDQIARDGAITDRDVAEIGKDLADALTHAHGRGVVHRDVKPQNAMVKPRDSQGRRAKLMDFGIAAVAGTESLTATGEVIGTLAYMAPEQADGEHVGPEADVYSLALTLYEAWAGENPIAAPTPAQTARRIGRPVAPLDTSRPDLPEALTAHIDACLDPDPRNRPTLSTLRTVLERTAPELDDDCAVPSPDAKDAPIADRSLPRVLGLVGAGVALAALAGPAGLPGLALVAALLTLPAIAVATRPVAALLPAMAIPLGAAGALAAVPVAIALVARRRAERAVLGALAFAAYLAGAVGLGIGERLGIAPRAADGWQSELGSGAFEVIRALADPASLAGAGVLALAAFALGLVLRAHPALGLVGVVLWAAGLAAGLATVGDGTQASGAAVAAVAAAAAVIVSSGGTSPAKGPVGERLAGAQPALHGGA